MFKKPEFFHAVLTINLTKKMTLNVRLYYRRKFIKTLYTVIQCE